MGTEYDIESDIHWKDQDRVAWQNSSTGEGERNKEEKL